VGDRRCEVDAAVQWGGAVRGPPVRLRGQVRSRAMHAQAVFMYTIGLSQGPCCAPTAAASCESKNPTGAASCENKVGM